MTYSASVTDELDVSIESLVALERYKRNHEFIDQVFSPYSVGKTSMLFTLSSGMTNNLQFTISGSRHFQRRRERRRGSGFESGTGEYIKCIEPFHSGFVLNPIVNQETLRKEHAGMEAQYKTEREQMTAKSKELWKAISEVKQAGSVEVGAVHSKGRLSVEWKEFMVFLQELDEIERRTANSLALRLKPHGVVEPVEVSL